MLFNHGSKMFKPISLSDDFELLARILSGIPGFITLQGTEADFLTANLASMQAMGFHSVEQMSGRYPADIKSKFAEIHDELVENNRFIAKQKSIVTSVFSAFTANGNWGLYLGQQQPLPDQTGNIIGVASQTLDITHTPLANKLAPLFLYNKNKASLKITQGVYRYTSCYEKWELSKRQGECLFWLLHRKSAVEIATILGLTKRTVESYIRHIKAKFKVSTISELLEFAHEQGLQHYIPKHWIS